MIKLIILYQFKSNTNDIEQNYKNISNNNAQETKKKYFVTLQMLNMQNADANKSQLHLQQNPNETCADICA